MLRSDLLGAWSGWLTPVFEPRRYRTWFFVAALPEGQVTRDVSSESSSVAWLPALDAVAKAEGGEIFMLPPTLPHLLDVGQHATPADVLAEARPRRWRCSRPRWSRDGDEFVLSMPPRYASLVAGR